MHRKQRNKQAGNYEVQPDSHLTKTAAPIGCPSSEKDSQSENGTQWKHSICSGQLLSSSQDRVGPWPLLCSSGHKLFSFRQHFHSQKHFSWAVSDDKHSSMSSTSRHPRPNFKCPFFPFNSHHCPSPIPSTGPPHQGVLAEQEELDLC